MDELMLAIICDIIMSPSTDIPSDSFFFSTLIIWYLRAIRQFSDESIKDFTMYHFVNMENVDLNGNISYIYKDWNITFAEHELLSFYARRIRFLRDSSLSRVICINNMNQLTESFFESTCKDDTFIVLSEISPKQVCTHISPCILTCKFPKIHIHVIGKHAMHVYRHA